MANFQTITPEAMGEDVFSRIGKQWMLIGAGNEERMNMMTASWGAMGVLWNKPVATVYIRPSRYTMDFVEQNEYFSLCFFDESHRQTLTLCGRQSGRDIDKIQATGLTPCYECEAPYFEEASLVVICRKLYTQDMDPTAFCDETLEDHYHGADYHRQYIGEIVTVMKQG